MKMKFLKLLAGCVIALGSSTALAADFQPALRVLFLGDTGHHQPAERFKQLQPVLAARHIEMDYTEALEDLNPAKLAGYDCLMIYANWTKIAPDQEKALLDFVSAGGGFVPLHCASYCFLNSPKYIALVGGLFKSHGTGVFKETIVNQDHPVMQGLSPIESWDESYVHEKLNPDRIVLAERRDASHAEPYTWVRTHGKGRVFYTAWGHDERTWSNPGFLALVENGVRWASANSPDHLTPHTGLKPFEYEPSPVPLPNYTKGGRWGAQSEPIRVMQKPLSPEESMPHLVLLPDFDVKLFASEPEIAKPIWMSWDERGRLWIAETVDYPNNMQPPGQGHDRIKICEDTDGDGRADKFTVFVDKLSVPTSFVLVNGGVIVVHSGKTEFFKEVDGHVVGTELFRGWGTADTHAGPSNLRYGFDNWIWGVVGYSGFNGTVGGKRIRFGQGIYRFKPDGSVLEFVRSSNNNTWGLGFTEDNLVIGSTANGNASMFMAIPNRYYEAVSGWSASRLETIADSQTIYPITEKVRQVDWFGKYTAGAGSAIYTARNFPSEYWNRVQFVGEPTGHLLGKFHLEARGSGFVAHNGRDFLASDDEWTAPICAEVGPDGNLWVIDWYNYIIQHNPTPQGFKSGKGGAYETPLRDKVHGRIYRVSYKGAKAALSTRLDTATPAELVAALKNDNMLWRMTAQRLLVQRGDKDVVPALCALIRDHGVDSLGLNPAATHALWTLKGLGALEGQQNEASEAARAALKHPAAGVRRAALMVAPRDETSAKALFATGVLEDSDAQVRLASLLALSELPPVEPAGGAIFAMLQEKRNSGDQWMPDAATAAAARNDAGFIKAVLASGQFGGGETPKTTAKNLLPNPSFENERDNNPIGWRKVTHSGQPSFALAELGHSGVRSVRVLSEQGADASWSATVPVQPGTAYKLSAWIKTENLRPARGAALGALLNVHEMQDPVHGATKGLLGNNDWTRVELDFDSGSMTEVTINCLMGGWAQVIGTAWFDDVELVPGAMSGLTGPVGHVVQLVTANYAQRGPVDSIVATLSALKTAPESAAAPILEGLVSGWPRDKVPTFSDADKKALAGVMEALPDAAKDRLLALAQRWGQTGIFQADVAAITGRLQNQVADSNLADDQRIAAAGRWIGLQDTLDVANAVLSPVGLLTTPGLASGLIGALAASHNPDTGRALTERWSKYTPSVKRAAASILLHRADWSLTLLDAIENKTIPKGDLPTEQWSQLKLNPNQTVSERARSLAAAAGAISADRAEIVNKLLPLAKEKGDPARGKEVFTANCAVCHTFNGQGGKIGPELTGLSARDPGEVLIDILDPNRSVEANYRLWNVTTKGGETYSGRLETETQTTVEILDITAQKHVVQRKEIASLEGTMLSIMPNGFEALPPDDLKSLLTYLCHPQ